MRFGWKQVHTEGRWELDFRYHLGKRELYYLSIDNYPPFEETGRSSFSKYHGKIDTHLYMAIPWTMQMITPINTAFIKCNLFNANFLNGKFKWGYFPSLKNTIDNPLPDDERVVTKSAQKWTFHLNRFFRSGSFYGTLQEMIIDSNIPEKMKQSVKELICPKGSLSLLSDDNQGSLSELEHKLSLTEK